MMLTAQPKLRAEQTDLLSSDLWEQLDEATDTALVWMNGQQSPNGSYPTLETAQPAVTALAAAAFMSAGHIPGQGPFGVSLDHAVEFMLDCQQPSGLFSRVAPRGPCKDFSATHTTFYNHAITGVCLCEIYGSVGKEKSNRIKTALEKALNWTFKQQQRRVRFKSDRGGWRYSAESGNIDSDVLVTAWQLMFLRSAKNAGFSVRHETVNAARSFIERCYSEEVGTFSYGLRGRESQHYSVAITGAAILSYSLAGKHGDPKVQSAGQWLVQNTFPRYRAAGKHSDAPYFYGVFYGAQASFQLGGETWQTYYPIVVQQLVENQRSNGSWHLETTRGRAVGSIYTTALSVLTLTTPNQLLPVFQR